MLIGDFWRSLTLIGACCCCLFVLIGVYWCLLLLIGVYRCLIGALIGALLVLIVVFLPSFECKPATEKCLKKKKKVTRNSLENLVKHARLVKRRCLRLGLLCLIGAYWCPIGAYWCFLVLTGALLVLIGAY